MWLKWLPWRFVIRQAARRSGFIDPISLLAKFDGFAEPSEVRAPTELLRAGIIMQARGFINNQAIQHNLDWVWPYWVEQQFNPRSPSFIPRAFSVVHLNITHRNWTAVGIPNCEYLPIIDPRGLITPHYDGWSLDFWMVEPGQSSLFPSRLESVDQELVADPNLCVVTRSASAALCLTVRCAVGLVDEEPCCSIDVSATTRFASLLVVSVRPFNPEGVSFIDTIAVETNQRELIVNKKDHIYFSERPGSILFSTYRQGDVLGRVLSAEAPNGDAITCPVGMASSAAVFPLAPASERSLEILVPLNRKARLPNAVFSSVRYGGDRWQARLQGACSLQTADAKLSALFSRAMATMVLHTPREVLAGPYTYKRFWFRDAVLITHPMLVTGLGAGFKDLMGFFFSRQKHDGHFMSQEGEWDSNGQVLWLLDRFRLLDRRAPDPSWRRRIIKAAEWIRRKRHSSNYPGLMPAGFSAEHLGPNDNYYWDDFWCAAGLSAASNLMETFGEQARFATYLREAGDLMEAIHESLAMAARRYGAPVMPASPHRRMDSAAVASLAASYPLQLLAPDDPLIRNTVQYLFENSFVNGALFHDISHSGINPYLSLHVAQAMLRAGDIRYMQIMTRIQDLASPTGQWPEGIHPQTGFGCMGDGQHVWAAAEWVMMVRNCFVREEPADGKLVLCSGVAREWLSPAFPLVFGPTLTAFGAVSLTLVIKNGNLRVSWRPVWHSLAPIVEVALPFAAGAVVATPGQDWIEMPYVHKG